MVVIVGSAVNLLMISGGIDLSVGSIMAISSITLAKLVGEGSTFPLIPAIIIAILAGLACGVFNALLVVNLNIVPIIATLGTLYLFRGIAQSICKNLIIGYGFPPGYTLIGQGYFYFIPIPVFITIFVFLIFYVLQNKTLFGKYIYAIGGNDQVAKLSGVPIQKVKFAMYSIVGLVSGISGVILTSRTNSAGPTFALGFEFDVILAVLLGGTKIGGGKGDVKGMLFAALILGVLNNGMNLRGIPDEIRKIISGIVFILGILLYKLIRRENILSSFD